MREKSGALLFYLWVGDALADGVDNRANTPEEILSVGTAYSRLSEAVGTPIEYVYQIRRPQIDLPYIDSVLETFPAVWGWTASNENPKFWDYLAKRCREKNRIYTQTVYPDYYTSKVYLKGGGHRFVSTAAALKTGLGGGKRHYRVRDLAQTQIGLLQNATDRDAAIINYATWNDFPEGHHLAPELTHNFDPAHLLKHFKRRWISGDSKVERDEAIAKTAAHEIMVDVHDDYRMTGWQRTYPNFMTAESASGEPELEFFKHLRTTWDDTRVLHGKVGEYAAIARRKGDEWWLGCLNAVEPRSLDIALDFLPAGGAKFEAIIYKDHPGAGARTKVGIKRQAVDSKTVLKAAMSKQGGVAMRIIPVPL